MRFRLRTLLIAGAILPAVLGPVGAWAWRNYSEWLDPQPVWIDYCPNSLPPPGMTQREWEAELNQRWVDYDERMARWKERHRQ
jgi:hypothetical protein